MANIMDYMDWRGDLTFAAAPLNEVDNLILAQLAYVEFDGIVSDSAKPMPIKEACDRFFATHDKNEIKNRVTMTRHAPFVLQKMVETKRFGDIQLFRYVNEISVEEETQFSAVCAALSDGTIFVAYSGTDSTIVGWKEDFNMSFLTATPGQIKAAKYLDYFCEYPAKLHLGGHSKGGNLSVYAAMHCKPEIRKQILDVYSDDGPGFSIEEIESFQSDELQGKIHCIIPRSSIVGLLMEYVTKPQVIKSSYSGPMQHDGLSWEVLGDHFVTVDGISQESAFVEKTLHAWMQRLDANARAEFVDTLFGILESVNIQTTEELARMNWKKCSELLLACGNLSKESQTMLKDTVRMLWEEARRIRRMERVERKSKSSTYAT
ncbi:MAG: Mbeg1-like protein [Lachnospiraceae bacterium]